jgi:hypothetical protein
MSWYWKVAMPPIVNVHNFLLSIRETGYRSFAHTLAELIDNSLQAEATRVSISVNSAGSGEISVTDNGSGMDCKALRTALQFGGSTRFGDRRGSGRFGMGLPTSSVTLARRVDVYATRTGATWHAYLDLDELKGGRYPRIREPKQINSSAAPSGRGTTVILRHCDRADKLRDPVHLEQTKFELCRIFRYPLRQDLTIELNNEALSPFDPLLISTECNGETASQYGPSLEYKLPLASGSGRVQVRFSELPVASWRGLPNISKQKMGISRGAGVSIVRANREIAYGWYFLGSKRRENYDDWWRCEVKFDPELDEYFGVNHTKQQITPSNELNRLVTPDIEHIARALNARVRREFVRTAKEQPSATVKAASQTDRYLPDLMASSRPIRHVNYRIEIDTEMADNSFYRSEFKAAELVVYLNANHPIASLYATAKRGCRGHAEAFEYLVLAAARAELAASSSKARWWFRRFRSDWSQTLATFLGN